MAPSIVPCAIALPVLEELGDPRPRVARIQRVADRTQTGGVDPLVQEQPGVGERGERGRIVGLGLDDVREIAPACRGVLVMGQQDVAVSRSGGGDTSHRAFEAAEGLRQLGAGVEDEERLERYARPFRHAVELGDDVRGDLLRDTQVGVDVGHDVRRLDAAQLGPAGRRGAPELLAHPNADVVADVAP